MTIGLTGIASADAAQTCLWTGSGNDNKFSTANNWSNCNSSTPQAGDIIKFNSSITDTTNLTNDLNVTLGGVLAAQVANNDGGSNYYYGTYHIDTLSLSDGASLTAETQSTCDTHAESIAVGALNSSGSVVDDIAAANNATLHISGNYTTSGQYITAGAGSDVAGSIIIEPSLPVPSDCGGAGGGGSPSGSSITGLTVHSLTVQKGASVLLADVNFPLTLGGGSGSDAPRIYFFGNYDSGSDDYTATTYTVSSSVTLLSDANFFVGDATTVNVTGSISGADFALSRDQDSSSTGVLNINPSSNDSKTQTGTLSNPVKVTNITDSQPDAYLAVRDNETTTLDGVRSTVQVYSGGILKGTGTTQLLYVSKDGTVAPGHSPGKLTVLKSLTMAEGSTYQAELKDTKAGDFDQLVVGNAADTTGNDVSITNAILDVQLYSGANMKPGDQFKIIDNLSQTDVSGTFKNLPEGATFKLGNGVMKITYKGGDGNDVVLTAQTAISAPDTGFALMSSHPVVTLGVAAIAAGFILVVAQSSKRQIAPVRAKARR